MHREIVQTKLFSTILDALIAQKKLLLRDYEVLEASLVKNPKIGDVIPGLSGLRKVRLKSSYSGKRGGFRVDYIDIPKGDILYLVLIYAKADKEDLTSEEKKELKGLVERLKNTVEQR